MNKQIDFVIAWVDGNDPNWQKQYCKYKNIPYEENAVRFRDWGILKYWFRAVERFAPWVNNIYFVTNGQKPDWLDIKHPKIKFIKHSDYIPQKYLPTFNSGTIEILIHKIEGLSENFVYFNDDMFINAPIQPDYYFKNGMPCDTAMECIFSGKGYDPIDKWGISIMDYCNTQVINAHFDRKKVIKENPLNWYGSYLGLNHFLQSIFLLGRSEFNHFGTPHNEKAFLKSVFNEVWKAEPELLENSCTQFRSDTNLTNYLMRYWQLASNKFIRTRYKGKKVIQLSDETINIAINAINDKSIKSLCLNDSSCCTEESYQKIKYVIKEAFERKLPKKSIFEL